jgi:hypothetical protein
MAGYFVNIPDLLNELVLGERGLESLNLVALSLQDLLSSNIDILEKQNLNVLGVEGLQVLGRATVREGSAEAGGRLERGER